MLVTIASGKGGTGKTTVATSLARAARRLGRPVQLVDCDVEEPNCHLFFDIRLIRRSPVTISTPTVDESLCNHCGECSRVCQFGAMICLPDGVLCLPELCHSCGGCALICPTRAITETPRAIGVVDDLATDGLSLRRGTLEVSEARPTPVISATKVGLDNSQLVVIDAPPGTSCAAVETIRGTDYVCLVAEPTPFGLNDLELAVEMVRLVGVPAGVVVNRSDMGDDGILDFCRSKQIDVVAELPFDRRVAEATSRGEVPVDALPEYQDVFAGLMEEIESRSRQSLSGAV